MNISKTNGRIASQVSSKIQISWRNYLLALQLAPAANGVGISKQLLIGFFFMLPVSLKVSDIKGSNDK